MILVRPSSLTEFFQALCFLFVIVHIIIDVHAASSISSNESDRNALIAFKNQVLQDPFGMLSSWNSSQHFCSWQGVKCGSTSQQRVTVLNLTSLELSGSLSPHIGNLTFLRAVDLSNNSFHGLIPEEIGKLSRLQILRLNNNSFKGEIPSNLSRCADLLYLDLVVNDLTGKIPAQFSSLTRLKYLFLSANHLTGTIPASLANLSSLENLFLMRNNLQGKIPVEFGKLSNLSTFNAADNNLSGTFPESLLNCSFLELLYLSVNKLEGNLPPGLFLNLPNLQNLALGLNRFSGSIPTSISNASRLVIIDLDSNDLQGSVPKNLGMLSNLEYIEFGKNPLGGDLSFLTSLTNSSKLRYLGLFHDKLRGSLPDSIANLSNNLFIMELSENYISGSIPPGIENLVNLGRLGLGDNLLTGSLPVSIGKLSNLQYFYAYRNKISGEIPYSLGNVTRLSILSLFGNVLAGSIPVSLGNCRSLQALDLSYNRLSGVIPEQVISLSSFSIGLYLNSNNLTGPLPSLVGNLKNLNELDISHNKLSGEIPRTLESCQMLAVLNISSNLFEGTIPSSFNRLRGLKVIDLSQNNLSGHIPEFLSQLQLTALNLSFNDLDGEVPMRGVFGNASAFSVVGNKKLCGGTKRLQLPACPTKTHKRQSASKVIAVVMVTAFIIISLAYLYAASKIRSSNSNPFAATQSESDEKYPKLSYADLFHATKGFSLTNFIGGGRYGSVYKGFLNNDQQTVAVKVFDLRQRGANEIFVAECEVLRSIRHRNLVKIITSCSSIDFKGNDFKALILEFFPNGSLDSWIHPRSDLENAKNLSLVQRLNIAINVASALDYLHNHCETPVAHCDLKPSNIFLDNGLTAHVGDFGLTKFISSTIGKLVPAESNSSIRGTIGYIAPEYAMYEKVSTLGDVYSYGVLLMELFTSRRPTDSMFADKYTLRNYVAAALPARIMEILDPRLTFGDQKNSEEIQEVLVDILQLGVVCSTAFMRERMKIRDVLVELQEIKSMLLSYSTQQKEK